MSSSELMMTESTVPATILEKLNKAKRTWYLLSRNLMLFRHNL
jgi:hypothetical protein